MALYIKFQHIRQAMELHVPISFEFARDSVSQRSNEIIYIYADGDEHELIVQRFPNLPHGHASTQWSGEFCRFIAENFTSLADMRISNKASEDSITVHGFVFPKGTSYREVKKDTTGVYYVGLSPESDVSATFAGYMFNTPSLGDVGVIIQEQLEVAIYEFHEWLLKRGHLDHLEK